ncbi:hypothetical protein JO972_01330 [Verrucomicrobiaceae bacterium 5K15]|uniref:Uncharacterized protein n=1 Tax=Oceaniferula flava TaxID=2800421 RepID=A0AAE2VCR5_9BACT|nr:hypothetical protein [Oceaniferula flavus]MBK1853589.1 hypothetical protein [Oceaniferula flavus]MBM1134894.1 hypothetical protein [Oceaniferula flavus]
MKIAFIEQKISDRGTSVAVYDYARHNEEILGNTSLTFSIPGGDGNAEARFESRFDHHYYSDREELDRLLAEHQVDFAYFLKHGKNDGADTSVCRCGIHCVFKTTQPHGDVYACISEYLNERFKTQCPVVPHMIDMPADAGDMRAELGIPADAIVYGRHGGAENFNLVFVQETVARILAEQPNTWFLFLNTDPFLPEGAAGRERCIHLPSTADRKEVARFINSCDAMLHARRGGETFGLACGEFSVLNKPVITWAPPTGIDGIKQHLRNFYVKLTGTGTRIPHRMPRAHLDILGDRAIVYHTAKELYPILANPSLWQQNYQDWDAYSSGYGPAPVMQLFSEVFLTPPAK